MAARARERFASGAAIGPDDARAMLSAILGSVAGMLFDESYMPVARFMVREQMDPTEAFDRVYTRLAQPQLALARRLVGIILDLPPDGERVRLRTLSLVGSIMFFRIAHGAATRELGWKKTGPRELAAIRELVADVVASLGRATERSS
jgi:hypothetical protein